MGFPTTRNKYKAVPVVVDGIRFPSGHEANRYSELKILERIGMITEFKLQVPFSLDVNGIHICTYKADFTYRDQEGKLIVEDAKGYRTPEFKLKINLMMACLHIRVIES